MLRYQKITVRRIFRPICLRIHSSNICYSEFNNIPSEFFLTNQVQERLGKEGGRAGG